MAFPPLMDTYRSASPLGQLQKEYGSKTPRRMKFIVFGIGPFMALIGLGICIAALMSDSTDTSDPDSIAGIIAGLLLFLGLGLTPFAFWIYRRPMRVRIYEHGLEWVLRSRRKVFLWQQIEWTKYSATKVYVNGVYTGTNYVFTLQNPGGEKLTLTHWLEGIEEIADRVERETYARLFAQAEHVIAQGGAATFGKMAISREGIRRGKKLLPWGSLRDVKVDRGFVRIYKTDKKFAWGTERLGTIPNARAFLGVLEQSRKAMAPRAA